MITLTKVDAARNMARFHTLDVQPTLFGEFALVREWGRIGGGSHRRCQWFATEIEATAAYQRPPSGRESGTIGDRLSACKIVPRVFFVVEN